MLTPADVTRILNPVELELFLKVVIAGVLGYLVGIERELAGREAGDRTFSLVTMGTALFTGVSVAVFGQVDLDPATRVIANILTGVGFLGAGMIVRGAGGVRGLTTAAGIWVMAAVGMAVGLGLYLVAGLTSIVVFVVFRSKQILDVRRMREPSS